MDIISNLSKSYPANGFLHYGPIIDAVAAVLGLLLLLALIKSAICCKSSNYSGKDDYENLSIEAIKERKRQKSIIEKTNVSNLAKSTFSDIFTQLKKAISNNDISAIKTLTTNELLERLTNQINQNLKKGLKNKIENISIFQVEIAESWHKEETQYVKVLIEWSGANYLIKDDSAQNDNQEINNYTECLTFSRYIPINNSPERWLLAKIDKIC